MARKTRSALTAAAVLAITSIGSHLVAWGLKIRTQATMPVHFGSTNMQATAIAAGSSLTFYGISWQEVSTNLGMRISGLTTPAASVHELETLQKDSRSAQYTFLGLSTFDLNENSVSDYRADVVPFRNEVAALWSAGWDWHYSKKVLAQYPLKYFRLLYPTAGRSIPVMVGIREQFRTWRRPSNQPDLSERAILSGNINTHLESISAWPRARLLRNFASIRANDGGKLEFEGFKRDSLFHFLLRGAQQGKMIVLVLPTSAAYKAEFVTEDVERRYEHLLMEAQSRVPEAIWIRLDRLPELQRDDHYWDLVHLNAPGQAIATKALLTQLAAVGIRP